ncbi:hypothetical protein ACFSR6_08245 [Pedobacter vanadiisoli]|uniref:Uncharacterized protein n=1 Tax=Pedobacter vanadiisoli TaxID=1761975 RepID=A0ABW5MH12_9SPHI
MTKQLSTLHYTPVERTMVRGDDLVKSTPDSRLKPLTTKKANIEPAFNTGFLLFMIGLFRRWLGKMPNAKRLI